MQIRAQQHYEQVDQLRVTAERNSYRSVSDTTGSEILHVLESVSIPSPVRDENVCQPVSVPQNS